MSDQNVNYNWIIYLLVGLAAAFAISRLLIVFRFAFFIFLSVGLIIGLVYWYRRYRKRKAYESSIEGQIDHKLAFCRQMLEQNQEELSDIQYNYRELQSQLSNDEELSRETWKELKRLSDGFASERKLRQTKIEFFRACVQKLERLKKNHEVARDLEQRQHKLKELREGQLEALAEMENLRSDLEYDQTYLETIDKLSLKLLKSQSPEQAIALQEELEEMTREIKD
ncbi:MAG: hypothetical protein GYB31_20255 [Bacteroidetes bacterium]|nr:hypothetical protein [Bacteroidota bacterium]